MTLKDASRRGAQVSSDAARPRSKPIRASRGLAVRVESARSRMQGAVSVPQSPASPPFEDDVVRVLRDDGTLDPAGDPRLDPAEVVAIYRAMVRVRALDERLVALQRRGRIAFHVGSQGEEAAMVAPAAPLRDADWIFPCYREFGAALWRGMTVQAYVSHMFGNEAYPIN